MSQKKIKQNSLSRGVRSKTTTKAVLVKFKTISGKTIRVRGIKTQKVLLGKKVK